MNILIISQHFPPERGAVRRLNEFARLFVRRGHRVSILTAIPNYPDGIVPREYKGRLFCREERDGVTIYRSWTIPASNREPNRRMIGFVLFLLMSIIHSLRIRTTVDLIIASSPPVSILPLGWLLSKLRRSRLALEIRDLEPESSEQFGNLRPSLMTNTLRKLVRAIYQRADILIAVTDGIAMGLQEMNLPGREIVTIKSGFDDVFLSAATDGIRRRYGWENKFLLLYAGTMGKVHALETYIKAACHFKNDPDIQFVFVGDGEKRCALENMVREQGLENVCFIGSQPLELIPSFLRASDVLIDALVEVPITKGTFPCKLFEYMASGRPILFGSQEGEAVRELTRAGGALSFGSDDVKKLCDLILSIKSGEIDGELLGKKYQDHAVRFHQRERWAQQYLDELQRL